MDFLVEEQGTEPAEETENEAKVTAEDGTSRILKIKTIVQKNVLYNGIRNLFAVICEALNSMRSPAPHHTLSVLLPRCVSVSVCVSMYLFNSVLHLLVRIHRTFCMHIYCWCVFFLLLLHIYKRDLSDDDADEMNPFCVLDEYRIKRIEQRSGERERVRVGE